MYERHNFNCLVLLCAHARSYEDTPVVIWRCVSWNIWRQGVKEPTRGTHTCLAAGPGRLLHCTENNCNWSAFVWMHVQSLFFSHLTRPAVGWILPDTTWDVLSKLTLAWHPQRCRIEECIYSMKSYMSSCTTLVSTRRCTFISACAPSWSKCARELQMLQEWCFILNAQFTRRWNMYRNRSLLKKCREQAQQSRDHATWNFECRENVRTPRWKHYRAFKFAICALDARLCKLFQNR
jgi:hypothetical protein